MFSVLLKMLNLGQSSLNSLKGDRIKIYYKIFKSKSVDPYYECCYIAEIGSNHYRSNRRRLR